MDIEQSAQERLRKLADVLAVRAVRMPELDRISKVPIGMEVEVPWSAYHPDLWRRYFHDGTRAYADFSSEEKVRLANECGKEEKFLHRLFQKAACVIDAKRIGKYYEYSLPPSMRVSTTVSMCAILEEAGLLPFNGQHRTQLTIGGVRPSRDAYCALMYLELRYGSGKRMLQGLGNGGWALKGTAGLMQKGEADLQFGYCEAVELRPLVLPADLSSLERMLYDCSLLADALHAKQVEKESKLLDAFCKEMAALLCSHGLPFVRWANPGEDEHVWRGFAAKFDSLRSGLKELARYGFC